MRIAVVLGSLLVALVGAGSAHAECSTDTSGGEIKAPDTAVAGATIPSEAYIGSGPYFFHPSGATLPVEAADPTKPISHPYTREGPPSSAWFDATVKTERGDGPIRVRLDWDESRDPQDVT